mgnify:CR=1 FL=1
MKSPGFAQMREDGWLNLSVVPLSQDAFPDAACRLQRVGMVFVNLVYMQQAPLRHALTSRWKGRFCLYRNGLSFLRRFVYWVSWSVHVPPNTFITQELLNLLWRERPVIHEASNAMFLFHTKLPPFHTFSKILLQLPLDFPQSRAPLSNISSLIPRIASLLPYNRIVHPFVRHRHLPD